METLGTGAGNLNIKLQIGSARILLFTFRRYDATTGKYTNEDISLKTFSFFLKRFKGDRIKTFELTNGNGITVPVYSTNQISVSISAANVTIQEAEYWYELRRTDLNAPKVSGLAFLTFDSPQ